jgi:tetratricopeptide (TPR) repeat protein
MNPNVQRGLLLYEQARWDQAAVEFQHAVLADPHDAHTRALLGLALAEQERYDEAEAEISEALQLDPALPFVHYARAFVLHRRVDYKAALAAVNEAIQLDPENADFRALQAQIFLDLRKWSEALTAAEQGLALHPEHISCTNLRAIALVQLGRRSEAGQTIDAALSRNPENSVTHANQGWALLHSGKTEQALDHFREALRLDPDNEWARQGTVEALKARYFIYSLLLKYFLWMGRLQGRVQWTLILGAYFGMRLLRTMKEANPNLAPFILPIQILYVTFVFLTWTAQPLFTLLLRLNRYGRMVLSQEEIVASNWIGSFVGIAALLGIVSLALSNSLWVFGLMIAACVIPLAAVFRCSEGWPRLAMAAYTAALLFVGLSAAFVPYAGYLGILNRTQMFSLIPTLMGTFLIGIILSGWVANILIMQRVRK